MKYLIIIFLLFYFGDAFSQSFYYPVKKKDYDSLSTIWLPGVIYLAKGEKISGKIHRDPDTDLLMILEGKSVKTFSPTLVLGFKVKITEEDSLLYVYMDVDKRKYHRDYLPLQIVIMGPITLFRYDWLSITISDFSFMGVDTNYHINSIFYFHKDGEIKEIKKWNKDLVPLVTKNPIVKEYYESISKKRIKSEVGIIIEELIELYNAQVVK